jgi:hypothetical protein
MSETLSLTATTVGRKTALTAEALDFFDRFDPRRDTSTQIEMRYQIIVSDPRYFQFAGIPDRIIHCLDLCGIRCEQHKVRERLQAFYLFIGLVDDEIECAQFEFGEKILKRLANPLPCFDDETRTSQAQFITEILKQYFNPTIDSHVMRKFRRLHKASVAERQALSMRVYVKQRKLVGNLTAELSYLLIRDHVFGNSLYLCRLMKAIGAVGCLVDSIFDARADKRAGVLSFRATFVDYLFLCIHTFLLGLKITLKHPRLIPLLGAAIRDNFYDRRRSLVI